MGKPHDGFRLPKSQDDQDLGAKWRRERFAALRSDSLPLSNRFLFCAEFRLAEMTLVLPERFLLLIKVASVLPFPAAAKAAKHAAA